MYYEKFYAKGGEPVNNDKDTDYEQPLGANDNTSDTVAVEDAEPIAEAISDNEVEETEAEAISDNEAEETEAEAISDNEGNEDTDELDWCPTGIHYSELTYDDDGNPERSDKELNTASDEVTSEPDGGEEFLEEELSESGESDGESDIDGDDSLPPIEDDECFDSEAEDEEDDACECETIAKPERKKRERSVGSRGVDTLFDFLELFIFTFVAVLIATSFLFRHSVVSGDSMMNTLQDADKLIISDLFWEPQYMDIVVVQDYSAGMDEPIVKRVIATEGDTVKVTPDGIYVNDQFLREDSYVYIDSHFKYYYDLDWSAFSDNETLKFVHGQYYEFTVPENEIFILGDHRNDSKDSRYYGTVREDSVLGRVIVRFYPFESFTFFERKGAEDGN